MTAGELTETGAATTTPATGTTTLDPGTSAGTTATTATTADPGTTSPGETTGETTGETAGDAACVDDHRVVAFVANWESCPTAEQMAQWSHAMIAFAVTYTWTPGDNLCDPTCTLAPVPGCLGRSLGELTADLHAAGVEVLLSFGGAGMGGVWEGTCGAMTKCWDACLDRAPELAAALVELVAENDLDGIDIDYEYCLDSPAYVDFLAGLTQGLRAGLDALPGPRKHLTHAPMDHELAVGSPYFDFVSDHAEAIDFLLPQYYNGGLSPFDPQGLAAIEDHYRALVDGPFGGDASRLVFGYCLEPGCAPVATQPAALAVEEVVETWFGTSGGIFFWAHPNELDAWFSAPFRAHYDANFCGDGG